MHKANENPAFFFFFLHQIDFLFIKFSAVFVISNILGHFNERIIVEWICKPICRQVKYFNRLHQHTGCKTHRLCTVHSWQAVYHKTGWCKSLTTVSGIEKKKFYGNLLKIQTRIKDKKLNLRTQSVKMWEENGYGVKIMQTDEDNPELMVRNIFRHSKSCPRTP